MVVWWVWVEFPICLPSTGRTAYFLWNKKFLAGNRVNHGRFRLPFLFFGDILENMERYVRVTEGVNDKGVLVTPDKALSYVKKDKDYYISINYYNDAHLKIFKDTGTIKGIKDVETDVLAFDFDSKDLEKARTDALSVINRLKEVFKIKNPPHIYFSGKKGFTIVTMMNKALPPYKVGHLALNVLGQNLPTIDPSLYNASRILRIPGTRHQDSGLFKIPLKYSELRDLSIDDIKELALEPRKLTNMSAETVEVPDQMVDIPEPKESEKSTYNPDEDFSFAKKPAFWKNCKWSLAQGHFKSGQRHDALMVLASTCRGLNFTKEMTYDLCKGALRRSVDLYGQGTTDKTELYKNIIEDTIFTDSWEGGQYTCKKPGFLQTYCDSLEEHKCKDRDNQDEDKPFVKFDEMFDDLVKFSQDFEKNILKTGIIKLDEKLILSTSTLNGLLGQPGAGKTTMAMNYLKFTSKMGISSAFFSLDMGKPIVTAKIIQQRTGLDFIDALDFVKNQPEEAKILASTIMKEDYANVNFTFKAGLTPEDMKDMIKAQEAVTGKKVKLVIVDYLECIAGPYGDQTANTGFIANILKDVANELEVCILLLLQTQKHSTPEVSDPLMSLKGVKGSSVIEQSCTTILTLWREGYSPKYAEDDKYISFAIVKNRFGSLWSGDFSWDGLTGAITSLTEEQRSQLWAFRKRKLDDKKKEIEASNKAWE